MLYKDLFKNWWPFWDLAEYSAIAHLQKWFPINGDLSVTTRALLPLSLRSIWKAQLCRRTMELKSSQGTYNEGSKWRWKTSQGKWQELSLFVYDFSNECQNYWTQKPGGPAILLIAKEQMETLQICLPYIMKVRVNCWRAAGPTWSWSWHYGRPQPIAQASPKVTPLLKSCDSPLIIDAT
jgi:hypothetical protein